MQFLWIPFIFCRRCRVLVYFVAASGEIVADALEFEVAGTLTNFVEIYASR